MKCAQGALVLAYRHRRHHYSHHKQHHHHRRGGKPRYAASARRPPPRLRPTRRSCCAVPASTPPSSPSSRRPSTPMSSFIPPTRFSSLSQAGLLPGLLLSIFLRFVRKPKEMHSIAKMGVSRFSGSGWLTWMRAQFSLLPHLIQKR